MYLPRGFRFSRNNNWLVNSLHHSRALVLLTHIEFLNEWTDFATQIHTHQYMRMTDAYVTSPNVNPWAHSLQKCNRWALLTVIDLIHLHWKAIMCVGCNFFESVSTHLHIECSRLAFTSPYDTFSQFRASESNSRQRSGARTHTTKVWMRKTNHFYWFAILICSTDSMYVGSCCRPQQ